MSTLVAIGYRDETTGSAAAESRFGGTVLKSSLSTEQEKELQEALHGQPTQAPLS